MRLLLVEDDVALADEISAFLARQGYAVDWLADGRDAAWQGFATHPLVSSPELGRKLLEGYEAGHPQIAALLSGR